MKLSLLLGACVLLLASQASAEVPTGNRTIEFDASTAEKYLFYAYAAYCPTAKLRNWSCKWCQESPVQSFSATKFPYDPIIDGHGFVGANEDDQTIVVSFKGTTIGDYRNYIVDLESIKLVPYKNSTTLMVGEGWQKEWNGLSGQVLPAVASLRQKYPNYSIWVTGHSLGAAVSIMCAVNMAELGYNVTVYNYGLPRVGNPAFSAYYNVLVPNTFRVVNGHDIVPHLPPMSLGFWHVPTEVWENPGESDTFVVCNGTGEDQLCSDSQHVDTSVYDHLHYLNYYEDCTDDDDPIEVRLAAKERELMIAKLG